jgi:endonuclease/exonuclease/phosphatase family metal-dependent hydrolase
VERLLMRKFVIGVFFWIALSDPAVARERALKVITYNVHYGAGPKTAIAASGAGFIDEIAGLIKAQHPDVVGLQEVIRGPQSAWINQHVRLAEKTGYTVRYKEARYVLGNSSGIVLMTPHTILAERLIELMAEGTYPAPETPGGTEHGERRLAQAALIQVPGSEPVWIVNTHFHNGQFRVRKLNYRTLQSALIAQLHGPVIVLGDFNSRTFRPEKSQGLETAYGQRILRTGDAAPFQDVLEATGQIGVRTFAGGDFRLDWIYFTPRFFTVDHAFVTGWQLSDHEAIVAVLSRKPVAAPLKSGARQPIGLLGVSGP